MAGRFSLPSSMRGRPNDPWFRMGPIEVTTTVLVVVMCVASMVVWTIEGNQPITTRAVSGRLFLWPEAVLDGQVWRLLTWPIPTEPNFWTVVMLAIFWYFGTQLEALLGRNRFGTFLLIVTFGSGIIGTLLDLPQAGLRTIELCVFVVYVLQYPFARFFFGIPAWVLAAVIVFVEFLQLLTYRDERTIAFMAIALVISAITARTMGLASELAWIPALPIGKYGRGARRPRKPKPAKPPRSTPPRRSSSGGDVISGPWSPPPPPSSGSGLPQPPVAAGDAIADQAELDALLDKISADGLDALSSAEKQRLNELSKSLRNRRS